MCANQWFQQGLMVQEWGLGNRSSGGSYCQCDCGAIQSIAGGGSGNPGHNFVANFTMAAAVALNAGACVGAVVAW